MKRTLLLFAAACVVLSAQDPAASFAAEAKQAYSRLETNLLKAAEKVPEEDYSFRATPDVRPFGELVAHVAQAQNRMCGTLLSSSQPAPTPGKTKAELVAALKASNEACDAAYSSVNDSNQAEVVGTGFLRHSRLGLLELNLQHDNEMYGTMCVYMRLKGLVPPSSEPKK
ncbi:MAG TPA: DinB family protein [Bryobacteraceae bacterium]|jgi:hypothetical protein|nr:DinB family protein [Bryobacteraceae bacterium]